MKPVDHSTTKTAGATAVQTKDDDAYRLEGGFGLTAAWLGSGFPKGRLGSFRAAELVHEGVDEGTRTRRHQAPPRKYRRERHRLDFPFRQHADELACLHVGLRAAVLGEHDARAVSSHSQNQVG